MDRNRSGAVRLLCLHRARHHATADTNYREGKISESFQEQYDRLLEIRNQLDRLSVTQAWSLRETDLFGYQRKLDRIDEARINGNFVDAEGQAADLHAQRVRTSLPISSSVLTLIAF